MTDNQKSLKPCPNPECGSTRVGHGLSASVYCPDCGYSISRPYNRHEATEAHNRWSAHTWTPEDGPVPVDARDRSRIAVLEKQAQADRKRIVELEEAQEGRLRTREPEDLATVRRATTEAALRLEEMEEQSRRDGNRIQSLEDQARTDHEQFKELKARVDALAADVEHRWQTLCEAAAKVSRVRKKTRFR